MKIVQDNLIRLSKEIDKSKFENVTTYYDYTTLEYVIHIYSKKRYKLSNTFSTNFIWVRNSNTDYLINYVNTKSFREIVKNHLSEMGIA